MATANFHARIERIEDAQFNAAPKRKNRSRPVREQAATSDYVPMSRPRRRKGSGALSRLFFRALVGAGAGVLGGGLLLGATTEGWFWGPGTPLNVYAMPAGLGALALAPVLMLAALFRGGDAPGFSFLSLSYTAAFALVLLV